MPEAVKRSAANPTSTTPAATPAATPRDEAARLAALKEQAEECAAALTAHQAQLVQVQDALRALVNQPPRLDRLPPLLPAALRRMIDEAGYPRSVAAVWKEFWALRRSHLFDPAFYLSRNPDLVAYRRPLELHYLLHGAREGRDPSPMFRTGFYLASNPDVAANGINPLIHYIRRGRAEGRQGTPDNVAVPGVEGGGPAEAPRNAPRFFDRLSFATRWQSVPLTPPPGEANPDSLDIHWVIPDFQRGAGGHMTIFRIVRFLERFGHRQTLWIMPPRVHATGQAAFETIREHFQPIEGVSVRFLPDDGLDGISGDALIATDRWTCYPVRAMANFRRRFYFVQDHECDFYPAGSDSLLTRETYGFGFDCLCAGEWLDGLMRDRYGLWSMKWDLAYDPQAYFPPAEGERPATPHIAFYSRYATPRRAVELGLLALEELAGRGHAFHVDLFGGRLPSMHLAFPFTDHGVMSAEELGALYRGSRVGMVFSATNHSLIPREMMACGLPLVELDIEPVTAVFPRAALELARPDPLSIADALERLLTDPARWEAHSRAGLEHARQFSWEHSGRLVEDALRRRLAGAAD